MNGPQHQRFTLVAATGPRLELPSGRHTAGTGPGAELQLVGPGIAPVHLVLTVARDRVYCQVRQPELPFTVNGKPSNGDVLRAGDELMVGQTMFRVESASVPEGASEGASGTAELVRPRSEQSTLRSHVEALREGSGSHSLVEQLDLVYRMAQLVRSVHDVASFGRDLLALVVRVVPASRAFLVCFNSSGAFEVIAAHPDLELQGQGPSATILTRVWLDDISLLTTDASQDPRLVHSASITSRAIRTALCAPVRHGEQRLGALYIDSTGHERPPGERELTLLESVASFAGVALSRARLYQDLKQREVHASLLVHDMKNPLASLSTGLELMERGIGDPARSIGLMRQAVEQLDGYISDVLSVAQLEESALRPQRTTQDLEQLRVGLLSRWEARLAQGEAELTVTLIPSRGRYSFDRKMIERVIDNLIENAVQHAPGEAVRVTIESSAAELRVAVVDGGAGVPEALREAIFDKYGRAKGREVGGRGFGLYFCRLAVQVHGGAIWAEGDPGESRFVFTLPAPSLDAAAASTLS